MKGPLPVPKTAQQPSRLTRRPHKFPPKCRQDFKATQSQDNHDHSIQAYIFLQ